MYCLTALHLNITNIKRMYRFHGKLNFVYIYLRNKNYLHTLSMQPNMWPWHNAYRHAHTNQELPLMFTPDVRMDENMICVTRLLVGDALV